MIKHLMLFSVLSVVFSTPLYALRGGHLDKYHVISPAFYRGEVTVAGFVKLPGLVRCFENMTLGDAINAAGGATQFGSIRRVELFRNGKRFIYDLKKPLHQQVRLQANDSISVPQRSCIGR